MKAAIGVISYVFIGLALAAGLYLGFDAMDLTRPVHVELVISLPSP